MGMVNGRYTWMRIREMSRRKGFAVKLLARSSMKSRIKYGYSWETV